MDWSKAKTILIVIFVLLNIFLGCNIIQKESNVTVVSEKEISDIKTILNGNNIFLGTELPKRIEPMSFLKIECPKNSDFELIEKYLGTRAGVLENKMIGSTIYKLGDSSLQINQGKGIVYINSKVYANLENFSQSAAQTFIEETLKKMNDMPQDSVIDHINSSKDSCEVVYNQNFKGYPIFTSQLNAVLQSSGTLKVEKNWAVPVGFVDTSKDIKTPVEILLAFAKDHGSGSKVVIKDIKLGYGLSEENSQNASVTSPPLWRIQTDDGKQYFYNAYEGYLEKM